MFDNILNVFHSLFVRFSSLTADVVQCLSVRSYAWKYTFCVGFYFVLETEDVAATFCYNKTRFLPLLLMYVSVCLPVSPAACSCSSWYVEGVLEYHFSLVFKCKLNRLESWGAISLLLPFVYMCPILSCYFSPYSALQLSVVL